jgi:[ribosomal protein S5]-alanine N-acetyltransferase
MTLTATRQQRQPGIDVHLRPVRLADWPTIHEWARRPDVTQYQAWGPNRAVETREYVVAAIEAARHLPQARHVLSVVRSDRVVGMVELTVIDAEVGIAEIGYAVHPDVWGRGVGTAAARHAVRFALDELAMRVVRATCDATNVASVRVLEKLGMRLEQTIPHDVWLGRRWRDTHVFSLRAEDATTAAPARRRTTPELDA